MSNLKIISDGKTDVGRIRSSNEDTIGLFPGWNLFVVADGMGGHAAGEVASRISVGALQVYFASNSGLDLSPTERLSSAIRGANLEVIKKTASDKRCLGMGTTVVALLIEKVVATIGHVGDSRAYLVRGDKIRQLTSDHSLVNQYVSNGLITQEEASRHPLRHIITRSLGMSEDIDVEVQHLQIKQEDVFILCSDGLTNMIEDEDILNIIISFRDDLSFACKALIDQANNRGGEDNISVIVIRCIDIES